MPSLTCTSLAPVYASGLLASFNRRDRMRTEILLSTGVIRIPLERDNNQGHAAISVSVLTSMDGATDILPSIESQNRGASKDRVHGINVGLRKDNTLYVRSRLLYRKYWLLSGSFKGR